jgi:ADP-ribose pyrophosphatase YjhB (NUDIX family)
MTRIEHIDNPNAPKANSLVPAASAIVTDDDGKILLIRRSDNDLWSIPGGAMEIGESISETAVREVREETGLEVEPLYVAGIYSNPHHVVEFSDGEVRQQFSICFACKVLGGEPRTSSESTEVQFFTRSEIDELQMTSSIRRRIDDYLTQRERPAFD